MIIFKNNSREVSFNRMLSNFINYSIRKGNKYERFSTLDGYIMGRIFLRVYPLDSQLTFNSSNANYTYSKKEIYL